MLILIISLSLQIAVDLIHDVDIGSVAQKYNWKRLRRNISEKVIIRNDNIVMTLLFDSACLYDFPNASLK